MDTNRIEIEKNEKLTIRIKALYNKGKQSILFLWIILWSLAGIGIMAQFFLPHDEDMNAYLLVWLAFWIFFEYKVISAYRWRKWGEEVLIIEKGEILLVKKIKERGIPRRFEVNFVKNIENLKEADNLFVKMMSEAYWNVGKESLVFNYKGKDVFFGKELDEQDSNVIQKLMVSYLNRLKD